MHTVSKVHRWMSSVSSNCRALAARDPASISVFPLLPRPCLCVCCCIFASPNVTSAYHCIHRSVLFSIACCVLTGSPLRRLSSSHRSIPFHSSSVFSLFRFEAALVFVHRCSLLLLLVWFVSCFFFISLSPPLTSSQRHYFYFVSPRFSLPMLYASRMYVRQSHIDFEASFSLIRLRTLFFT